MATISTLTLAIDGMHCASCALLIDDALADLPGVLTAATSARANASTVTHDQRIGSSEILSAIEELGYRATAAGAACG